MIEMKINQQDGSIGNASDLDMAVPGSNFGPDTDYSNSGF
jgi:hypothetical protein